MFHIHGIQGRVFSGTLEQLRQHPVSGVERIRRLAPVAGQADPVTAPPWGGGGGAQGSGARSVQAYDPAFRPRRPLTCAADVMHRPAYTVRAESTLREAWQLLAHRGIGQAPVVGADGRLVGLVGRAELMPAASPDLPSAASQAARLSQAVASVMWSPVPSTAPGTDLRRVAALLLHTGLPGVPVAGEDGEVLGFVSRTDLLRALTTAPPLDLWG